MLARYKNQQTPPWASEHIWKPIMNQDYSSFFDQRCTRYNYYLNAVIGTHDFNFMNTEKVNQWAQSFAALGEYIFAPKGFYIKTNKIPTVFDSGLLRHNR